MTDRVDRRDKIGLPARPFLFTLDQVATILNVSLDYLRKNLLHYRGRSIGSHDDMKMEAVNIAPEGKRVEWRISESELIRWMRRKGFKYYERGWL